MRPQHRAAALLAATLCFLVGAMLIDVWTVGGPRALVLGLLGVFAAPVVLLAVGIRRRWSSWTVALACAAAATLVFVAWHPRKRFVWTVRALRAGMTVDEVEPAMAGYIRDPGPNWEVPAGPPPVVVAHGETRADADTVAARAAEGGAGYRPPSYPDGGARAHATGSMVYRWTDEGWAFDADMGLVEFVDGRLVRAESWPD